MYRGMINMSNTINSELFNRIISEENIYNAIYGLDSYIFDEIY